MSTSNPKGQDYLAVIEDEQTGLYHGAMFRFHPTPSGCARWVLGVTTSTGYEVIRPAAAEINNVFPDLPQIDVASLTEVDISGLVFPKGAEITLVTPHDDGGPCVTVEVGCKRFPIEVSVEQFRRLRSRGIIEMDSSSGDDPELSARYDHYRVVVNLPRLGDHPRRHVGKL